MDDWIRVAAKAGGLEEQEIREFDKQAMGSDSLILNHLGKLKSFTTGQKRGILTRDYICLYGGNMPCVLKLSRLTQAYIKDNTYYVKVGKTRKQAHYLTIHRSPVCIIASHTIYPPHCYPGSTDPPAVSIPGHRLSNSS